MTDVPRHAGRDPSLGMGGPRGPTPVGATAITGAVSGTAKWGTANVAKLVYSLILLFLVVIFLRELYRIWFDKRVYVGEFTVMIDAEDKSGGTGFAAQVAGSHGLLASQIADYTGRSTPRISAIDSTFLPQQAGLHLPTSALGDMAITYNSINFTDIFNKLHKLFAQPDELRGVLEKSDFGYQAKAIWPRAPTAQDTPGTTLSTFTTPIRSSQVGAARSVACTVTWAQAAAASSEFAKVSRQQFCDWAEATTTFLGLESRYRASAKGLAEEDQGKARDWAHVLAGHLRSSTVFPEIFRLRADLLDLIPADKKTDAELVAIQNDRVRYAMTDPALEQLATEPRRFAALALARPAIAVTGGKVQTSEPNWAGLLSTFDSNVATGAAATGYFYAPDQPNVPGFAVAPNRIVTFGPALARLMASARDKVIRFCFDEVPGQSCGDRHIVTFKQLIVDGDKIGSHVALVATEGHDTAWAPPLALADTKAAQTLVNRFAFVVGYPERMATTGMPQGFVERLIPENVASGVKRVLPGRTVAVGRAPAAPQFEPGTADAPSPSDARVITTDVSSTPGTAGGPLIDLHSGQVLGMHFAGRWHERDGKFGYAEMLPAQIIEAIMPKPTGAGAAPGEPVTPPAPPPNPGPTRESPVPTSPR